MTMEMHPEDLVVAGVITGVDTDGIDLKILHILRGTESRDTIRIWDGTDFDCNGFHSMAASDIGVFNDTVILILPLIIFFENSWDVEGDYRRPDPYRYFPQLWVHNGQTSGFISGDWLAPPEYNLWQMAYSTLIDNLMEDGDCSFILSSTSVRPVTPMVFVNNPFNDRLTISFHQTEIWGQLRLHSLNGITWISREINSADVVELEVDHLPAGMYVLEILTTQGREVRKIIKQTSG